MATFIAAALACIDGSGTAETAAGLRHRHGALHARVSEIRVRNGNACRDCSGRSPTLEFRSVVACTAPYFEISPFTTDIGT